MKTQRNGMPWTVDELLNNYKNLDDIGEIMIAQVRYWKREKTRAEEGYQEALIKQDKLSQKLEHTIHKAAAMILFFLQEEIKYLGDLKKWENQLNTK